MCSKVAFLTTGKTVSGFGSNLGDSMAAPRHQLCPSSERQVTMTWRNLGFGKLSNELQDIHTSLGKQVMASYICSLWMILCYWDRDNVLHLRAVQCKLDKYTHRKWVHKGKILSHTQCGQWRERREREANKLSAYKWLLCVHCIETKCITRRESRLNAEVGISDLTRPLGTKTA